MASQSLPTVRLATPSGSVVCEHCEVALTRINRLRYSFEFPRVGSTTRGMLRKPASWTHTMFGNDPVDVVFLDTDLRVVKMVSHLVPWRLTTCNRASAVVTLAAGEAGRHGLQLGLRLVSNPSASA